MRMKSILVTLIFAAAFAAHAQNGAPTRAKKTNNNSNWPAFRGTHAAGVADGQNLPETWDAAQGAGIKWKTRIPGLAHSSPIVWGDKVFVTTAVSSKADASFKRGLYGDGDASEDRSVHQWKVYGIPVVAQSSRSGANQQSQELARLLADGQIKRIEILHVSDSLLTRTALTPKAVRDMSRHKVVITESTEHPLLKALPTALKDLRFESNDGAGDLRWAILFFDASGAEKGAVFLDRFGTRGSLGDVPFSAQGKLLKWSKDVIQTAFLTKPTIRAK